MDEPNALLGKVILIGVSLHRADGEFIRKTQLHGVVKALGPETGIVVEEDETGKEFYLPPAFTHIHPAVPGVYRARDTGAEVANPDFVTEWAATLPEGADETTIDWQRTQDWCAAPPPEESPAESK
jgi:hypothetical protein